MIDVFEEVAELRSRGERGALCTVVSTTGSTPGRETMRMLVRESGSVSGSVGGGCVEADVVAAAREVIETETPRRLSFRLTEEATGQTGLLCGGEIEIFVEPISAPHVVLFGGGHVSRSLCAIAADAGFRVTVCDDRPSFVTAERFPQAHRLVSGASFDEVFASLRVPPSACCVVVTRGHAMDQVCTDFALHTEAPYVGLIGSKVKVRGLLARLRDADRLDGVDLARLHAPIGLDVGSATHGEIAVSVVAELVAFRRHRLDGLRLMRLPLEEMQRIAARRRGDPGEAGPA
ncbi:MAG: XdhC family protein [Planctomycetes bacterium]|nr:XdhC family protein [Planctomycetota bacterium]